MRLSVNNLVEHWPQAVIEATPPGQVRVGIVLFLALVPDGSLLGVVARSRRCCQSRSAFSLGNPAASIAAKWAALCRRSIRDCASHFCSTGSARRQGAIAQRRDGSDRKHRRRMLARPAPAVTRQEALRRRPDGAAGCRGRHAVISIVCECTRKGQGGMQRILL